MIIFHYGKIFGDAAQFALEMRLTSKEKKLFKRELELRRNGLVVGMYAYFVFHGHELESSLFCANAGPCSVKPRMSADGTCYCMDTYCSKSLLSRLSQAGGSIFSSDSRAYNLEDEMSSVTLDDSCSEHMYFDKESNTCVNLDERFDSCGLPWWILASQQGAAGF